MFADNITCKFPGAIMTNKEREMFELLRVNPGISQNDLARRLNITRSSISVHISNLIRKGFIKGRGYILSEPGYVTVIGATNVDILGRSKSAVIPEDSNPGKVEICAGGVGRNIAENLARIGVSVKMLSCVGNDVFGDKVIEMSTAAGIDMSHCFVKPNGETSIYIAIVDNNGEMNVALSDMSILDEMPTEYLAKKQSVINNSEILVLDAGLTEEMFDFILANFAMENIFVDPVSIGKSEHIKKYLAAFHTIKCNRLEASYLSGIDINDKYSLRSAGAYFIGKGIKRVFISLAKDGLYYLTKDEEGVCPTLPLTPVNATGAGDALMAGIIYATLNKCSLKYTAMIGNAMSRIALMSPSTVSALLSIKNLNREMEKQLLAE
jgi:pseudouridine kinase